MTLKAAVLIFLLFIFIAVFFTFKKMPENSLITIRIGEVSIRVKVADTSEKRARGLSQKSSLSGNEGMIFIFEKPGFYSFWMKDMKFPIDIIWIDENRQIADIFKNIQPNSFPESFKPAKPALYVLEVNAGFSERNDISAGDVVYWPGI